MIKIRWLDPANVEFPAPRLALDEPNGLLAAGGDLSPQRLVAAYRAGIFPWYEQGQPILWWTPSPRTVLFPHEFKISRSLRRTLRSGRFEIRVDTAFDAVVEHCSQPRDYSDDTWITTEMKVAYGRLHRLGHAHSVEAWQDGQLAGGLYGVALGKLFFGESMFHDVSDASKVTLASLCRFMDIHGCPMIDCQMATSHLASLGARAISRREFEDWLVRYRDAEPSPPWHDLPSVLEAW